MNALPTPARRRAAWLLVALSGSVPAAAQTMTNQHVSSAGVQASAGADGNGHSVSDDERFVAFGSPAANLVAGDTNARTDIFVHDDLTGATVLVSRNPAGAPANGDSFRPWLSGDGRFVGFQSTASDLVAGASGSQVYRHDRDTDADGVFDEAGATATILVSQSSGGAVGSGASRFYRGGLSDDGERVVFESLATNLAAGDTNGTEDCFLRVISTGTTSRVSLTSGGGQASGGGHYPAIAGNGSAVLFASGSSDLVLGDTNGAGDVFVRNLAAGTTVRASVTSGGGQGNAESWWSSISDAGTRVAFESSASNLVGGDTNGSADVFVRDLALGTTVRASVASSGVEAALGGNYPFIAGSGDVVVFASSSADLVPGDTNGFADVFVRDLAAGTTARASRAAAGTQASAPSGAGSASDDGSHVVFFSTAADLVPGDANGAADIFLRGDPFSGPVGPVGPAPGADPFPVAFSVNGPVDPHTEGIRDPRGAMPSPQIPPQPGNPIGFCIRDGPVPQASGIDTAMPGDVFDYDAALVPSEAVLFQSPPFPPPGVAPAPPDGTNNQILEAPALGLMAGPGVPATDWLLVPPMAPARDNVDALSFGEDYFPPGMMLGLSSMPPLPPPPTSAGGEILAMLTPWAMRTSMYAEPVVEADGPGVSFRFSTDPWAIGVPVTALRSESLGADAGAGCGPWTSGGQAAGDVLASALLARAGGLTLVGGGNSLVHDELVLALLGPLALMEDDLDALECVGDNTSPWFPGGMALRPGDLHQRVMEVGPPDPNPPGVSAHEPFNLAPVFFSVTRNSPGMPFTAVRAQFVAGGGAGGDVFAAVKNPMDPAGIGTSLLLIDNFELGVMPTDDLDALILWVCPEYRPTVSLAFAEILALAPPFTLGGYAPWSPTGPGDAFTGGGMTLSITKYLEATGRMPPPGCIQVGFSVTTDSIGLEYTAVDWEAGPVFPPGGVSAAAGDVFYTEIDGSAFNSNYIWYEEVDLGEDEGAWVPGTSTDLAELPDNLDALDSLGMPPDDGTFCFGDGSSGPCPCGNESPAGSNVGCLNSLGQAGALRASGMASVTADATVLAASGMTGLSCVFYQGDATMTSVMLDDGLACVSGTIIRLGTRAVTAGVSSYPSGGIPISVRGMLPAAGGTRYYQCFYRNAAAFCTPFTSNRTNGVTIVWTP